MAPKHSAEMLTGVPKHEKAMIFLMEKIYVPSGISYGAVQHKLNVNELHIYFLFK